MFGGLLCCWAIIVALLCGADGARVGEGTSTDPTDGYGKGSRSLLIGGRLANASQYPYYVQAIVRITRVRYDAGYSSGHASIELLVCQSPI